MQTKKSQIVSLCSYKTVWWQHHGITMSKTLLVPQRATINTLNIQIFVQSIWVFFNHEFLNIYKKALWQYLNIPWY